MIFKPDYTPPADSAKSVVAGVVGVQPGQGGFLLATNQRDTLVSAVSAAPVVARLLDFAGIADVNPFVPADHGWTQDRVLGNSAQVVGGKWRAVAAALGMQCIHADQATLDMNGAADVFVEVKVAETDGNECVGAILSANYTPGNWQVIGSSTDTLTGYRVVLSSTGYTVFRHIAGSDAPIMSDNAALANGTRVKLRATVNSGHVAVGLYFDGVLIDSDNDTHASRPTNFRTAGAGVASRGTGANDQAAIEWIHAARA